MRKSCARIASSRCLRSSSPVAFCAMYVVFGVGDSPSRRIGVVRYSVRRRDAMNDSNLNAQVGN